MKKEVIEIKNIKNKIYTIREKQVMIDNDLAKLYNIETKNLNKAVKRNIKRFTKDFMFQLTENEYNSLRFQFGTFEKGKGKYKKYLPYAFTEQGIAGLSGILKSNRN